MSSGWNEYTGKRHILFTGVDRTVEAKIDEQNYTAFVSTGYHFPLQKFTITSLASLQYTHMDLDDFTETGAGDINLKVDSQDYNFLESGLGVKVERSFGYNNRMTLVPDVHLKWFHELSNPSLENTASFISDGTSSITTPELQFPENTYNVGAGSHCFRVRATKLPGRLKLFTTMNGDVPCISVSSVGAQALRLGLELA